MFVALVNTLSDFCPELKDHGKSDILAMDEQIVRVRTTKLEILMCRVLLKDNLPKSRKEKLLGEQRSSFVKDLSDWQVRGDWTTTTWPVLLDITKEATK